MRFTLSTAALALALIVPVTAATAAGEETVTVRVDLADIDLSSSEGREAAEARLNDELRAACTIKANPRYSFGRDVVDQKCLSDARNSALTQVERIVASETRSGGAVAAN